MFRCSICRHEANSVRHHGFHEMDMHHRAVSGELPKVYARVTWRHNSAGTGVVATLFRDGQEPSVIERPYSDLETP